jgi:hypothetical protein
VNEIEKIIIYMLDGLEDYEIDKKLGDVGSKVRKSAMKALTTLMIELYDVNNLKKNEFVTIFKKYVIPYLNGLLKQLVEKMAKMRLTAGDCLQKFFYEFKEVDFYSDIPNFEEFKLTFLDDIRFNDNNKINNMSWLEPSYGYKKVIHFLNYETYSLKLFEGLVISIGGLTEDTQRNSLEELDNLIKQNSEEGRKNQVKLIYSHIIQMFTKYEKDDKVIEPLYNTLAHLLTKNYFVDNIYLEEIDKIHKFILKENNLSKNIHKVLSSVDIYYNLLYFEKEDNFNIFTRSLKSLLVLMTHS